jgi:hypothetical protein
MTTNKLIDLGKVSEETKGMYVGGESIEQPFTGNLG